MTKHGFKDASTDPDQIREWWHYNPDANIGIPTGQWGGIKIFVLDIDGSEGEAALKDLMEKYGSLPPTMKVRTGRGEHWYYKYAEGKLPSSAGKIGLHLDIRGDGAYIVGAGSRHHSGCVYQRVAPPEGEDEPADAPDWLINLIRNPPHSRPQASSKNSKPISSDPSLVLQGVPHGQRDDCVFKYGCSLRARGVKEAEVVELVRIVAERCDPPFPEAEWRKKISQAFKYPNGREEIESARETVRTLLTLSDTEIRTEAFQPAYLSAAVDLAKDDPGIIVQIKDRLPNAKQAYDRALKKERMRRVPKPENAEFPTVHDLLSSFGIAAPEGCGDQIVPRPYVFDENGIAEVHYTKDGDATRVNVAPEYVLVTGRRFDLATSEFSLEVARHTTGRWETVTGPRASFLTSNQLCEHANHGLPVSSTNSKLLSGFLFNIEQANIGRIKIERTSSQLGWTNADSPLSFLLGDQCIGDNEIRFHPCDVGDDQIAKGFHEAGDFNTWLKAAQAGCTYPRVAALFYGALTAPMLLVFGLPTFLLDLAGSSSSGKTTALMIALSSFGNPALSNARGILHSWCSTRIGLERICAIQTDLPLGLDDTKTITNPKLLGQFIYAISEGHGKLRGSIRGTQVTRRWRTVAISTGEAPLNAYSQDGGAQGRVLSIRGLPFAYRDQTSRAVVAHLTAAVSTNYGHLGPLWIEYLLSHRDQWLEWQKRFRQNAASYIAASPFTARVADMRAAITTTGEIIHESGLLPWEFTDPFDGLWPAIEADLSDADIGRRALQAVYSWAVANQGSFYGRGDMDSGGAEVANPVRPWLGRWDRGDDWSYLGILPHVLTKTLSDLGYDSQAALASWEESGWLRHDKGRNKGVQVRLGKERVRVTAIRREAVDEVLGLGEESTR